MLSFLARNIAGLTAIVVIGENIGGFIFLGSEIVP
jgi:hypothetical protein